jgi:hypothetical protein
MLWVLLIVIACGWMIPVRGLVSYTANGTWVPATNTKFCDQFLCVGKNKVFAPTTNDESKFKVYNASQACSALLAKGIKRINFHGDSYMRQIYAAVIITLRGDYRYGSIADPIKTPQCEYHKQFNEKNCGVLQLNHLGDACNGKLKLDPLLTGLDNLNECKEQGTVSLWSFGNHKLGPSRWGVNNATAYASVFNKSICPQIKDAKSWWNGTFGTYETPCSVWWVSTHQRSVGYFLDEKPEVVERYNREMREFFDRGRCGAVNYIDVFNMTSRLVQDHNEESLSLTYDRVHWGMEINLWKAQIIINALLAMPDK